MTDLAVKKIGLRYRVVDAKTGVPVFHDDHHNYLDDGGHKRKAVAERQVRHIEAWYRAKERAG